VKNQLICAIAISFAFLACNDNNAATAGCKDKALAKTCVEDRCYYDESDKDYFNVYDHNWLRIEDAVKEWMDEQIASGGNEKKQVIIIDFFIHENYVNTLGIQGPTEYEYYVDGERVSYAEWLDASNKMQEYYQAKVARGKRDLPLPGAIIYETDMSWTVSMTAKEIAELTENYKLIAVELYREAIPEGGSGIDEDALCL